MVKNALRKLSKRKAKKQSSVVGTTTLSPISADIAGRHRIPALDDSAGKGTKNK